MTCTSPCIISGLDPGTEYQFTVISSNNHGSPTGCTGNMATAQTACECDCICIILLCTHVCTLAEHAGEFEGEVTPSPSSLFT